MGIYSYLMEHSPEARRNRVQMAFLEFGFQEGVSTGIHETVGFAKDAASLVGLGILIATPVDEGAALVSLTSPSVAMTSGALLGKGIFYDPGRVDPHSYAMTRYRTVTRNSIGSIRRSGGPVQAKTSGGTKTFKTGSSGQSSKPFWSNGKPKCKKGFRYDFKRKLCVKIK
ncbi:hypothetical protein ES705_36960 [subsurface metagenome]